MLVEFSQADQWISLDTIGCSLTLEAIYEKIDFDDAEHERLWVKEAEARYQAYQQGMIAAKPAEDAIREVRNRLQ